MPSSSILALATAVTGASAAFTGFNYDNKGKSQQSFEAEFKNAQGLEGTDGKFNSARLYTMIQDGTASDPISAIPAAISTKTSLLFGLWASGGQAQFDNEISALKKAAEQYCDKLDGLVAGISVGSEDLYRDSPIGQAAGENPGAGPALLSKYVDQTRDAVKGTCFEKAPIGHVDTWTAYANSTNREFSDKLDWVGMDAYPYYENQKSNGIENAKELFQAALDNTNAGTGNKPLWITETGWPVSGQSENKAQANIDNAKTFWQEVGCPRFGNVNLWWFTMQDGGPNPGSDKPSFGVVGGNTLTTKPLFDLSCKGHENGGSGSSSSASSSSQQSTSTQAQTSSSAAQTSTTSEHSSAEPTSASSSTPVVSSSSSGPIGTGVTPKPSSSQPAGSTGNQGSNTATTSPSATNTPPAVGNSAAGLNSFVAAVAAMVMAVAAF